ncbi:MAG: tyrosine-type recombinase/integrase [Clostridiales bacterium]|nr:tyrosine-type recombinase/integrase [Clostridiales bacterium]
MQKLTLQAGNEGKSLRDGFKEFIQTKTLLGLAPETITTYQNVYRFLSDYIKEDTLCSDITNDTILGFIQYHKDRNPNISNITINSYIRNSRAILYFFMERGYMPQFKIKIIKCEKPIKEVYTDHEIQLLTAKPDIKRCSFAEYRNWVMVCYMLGTANRVKTICNIRIGDIDFDNEEIQLSTVKNKRAYIVPLSPTLSKILKEYLTYRKGTADDWLFCNQFGKQMCKDAVTAAIRTYNHKRGVSKTSSHLFRHTFAKNWILSGGDPFRLQKILGHRSFDMVREYVEMYGNDLKLNYAQFNALDQKVQMTGHIKMGKK